MYTHHIPDHQDMTREPILSIWRKINEREEEQKNFSDTDDSSDETDESSPTSFIN